MNKTSLDAESLRAFGDPADFTRGLMRYLRARKELLDAPDYARLYEETLDFQLRFLAENYEWDISDAENSRRLLEFIVDVQNEQGDARPPIPSDGTVEAYLERRRKVWENQN